MECHVERLLPQRHEDCEEYIARREESLDRRTVRDLAVYRNKIAHAIEIGHEDTRAGFSDEFGPEFQKCSHHFLPLADEVSRCPDKRPKDSDGRDAYQDLWPARRFARYSHG